MAITLRLVKGSPLTYTELDNNFIYISQSYVMVAQTSSMTVLSSSYAATASYSTNAGVFPFTGSAIISGSLNVIGAVTASNMLVLGTLQTNVLYSQIVTSSTSYSSGSNIFGNDQSNTHQFTGSLLVTGSVFLNGLTENGASSILVYDSGSGQVYYTSSISSLQQLFAVTGSTLYSLDPAAGVPSGNATDHGIFIGESAGGGSNAINQIAIGSGSGYQATNANYSNFIGDSAGVNAANADNSNFIGANAGDGASGAYNSNFIGQYAGNQAVTAYECNFIGTQAGDGATTAQDSNFIGYQAGQGAINAYNANFFGVFTGQYAAQARDAVMIGRQTGQNAYSASYAFFVGADAGKSATNAFASTFLGLQAGYQATNANYGQFIGLQAGYQSTYASSSNFIGTQAGYQATYVDNANFLGLQAGYQASYAANSNFIGAKAGHGATNADNSNFIGYEAGSGSFSANYSNYIGYQAGTQAPSAASSNFIGQAAGYSASNATYVNFIGVNAGYQATDALASNFIGQQAGYKAPNAYASSFIGAGAGSEATDAYLSNFLGDGAGQSASYADNSNFIGNQAGFEAIYANTSNFIGVGAGYQAYSASGANFIGDSTGQNATDAIVSNFIGTSTGFNAVSASYSTLIGYKAGYAATTASSIGSNNIIIGTNISLASNTRNAINIGGLIFATGSYATAGGSTFSGSVGNGKVGINVVAPTVELDVSGSSRYSSNLTVTGSLRATNNTLYVSQSKVMMTGSLVVSGSTTGGISGSWNVVSYGDVDVIGTLWLSSSVRATAQIINQSSNDGNLFWGGSDLLPNANLGSGNGGGNIVISPAGTYTNLSASQNTIVGRNAANTLTTGNGNTVLGKNMGFGLTTGQFNTLIGAADATNLPAATSYSTHIVAAGYELNNAANFPSTPHCFIGGGYDQSSAVQDYYFGLMPFSTLTANNYADIRFNAPSATGSTADSPGANFTLNAGRGTGTGSAGDIVFGTSTTGSTGLVKQTLSNRVWIKGHTGNVGINEQNPHYKLVVSGSGASGSLNVDNTLYVSASAVTITGSLTVSGSNVGINTTASSAWSLDVRNTVGKLRVGNSNFTDVFTVGVGSGGQGYSDLYLNGQTYAAALYGNPQAASGYVVNGITYSTASVGLIAGGSSSALVLGSQGTEKVRIQLTGDVSIGTQEDNKTLPGYKLNVTGSGVSGSLNINNKLIVSSSFVTINDILALTVKTTTPTAGTAPTGSIMVSGSGAQVAPYFYNGTSWVSMI